MPTLDWIGKQAVVQHHREVPVRLLHCDGERSAGDADAGNLIVQGDNLKALKALLPFYAGKVKCIYIDPPYNTGNQQWRYNDNVDSPEIRAWLNREVGKEAEDLSRHDKWLCMMYPRLRLLREFLSEDGSIFVSIDDNEVNSLRLLMDEIFGRSRFIATNVWQKRYSREESRCDRRRTRVPHSLREGSFEVRFDAEPDSTRRKAGESIQEHERRPSRSLATDSDECAGISPEPDVPDRDPVREDRASTRRSVLEHH